jgi:hypothetical protein
MHLLLFLAENGQKIVKMQIQWWGFVPVYKLMKGEVAARHPYF